MPRLISVIGPPFRFWQAPRLILPITIAEDHPLEISSPNKTEMELEDPLIEDSFDAARRVFFGTAREMPGPSVSSSKAAEPRNGLLERNRPRALPNAPEGSSLPMDHHVRKR